MPSCNSRPCMQQAASLDFFFFGGALSNDTTLRESCTCLYSCMVPTLRYRTNKPWLQLDLCFARLGVCLPDIDMLRNARYLCLCFPFPILLCLRKTNNWSHDERRTAVLCTRTAGWRPGMMANTANGGHSHGNADQDPDEGTSAPGGKEGEIRRSWCVAMMIPWLVAFQRLCGAVPGPWPRLAHSGGQASRRYSIDFARTELRSHFALPWSPSPLSLANPGPWAGLSASYFVLRIPTSLAGRIDCSAGVKYLALVAHADAALHWRRTLCLVPWCPALLIRRQS